MDKLKVYCLPYAGGTKMAYSEWKDKFAETADIIPLEYNGHGERYGEPFYASVDEAVDDLCARIIKDQPLHYIVYGHSFGSMLAVLVAEKLEQVYANSPKAVIIGGMRPMHLKYKDRVLRHLPKDEFMQTIYEMGQTSEEIMNEPELVDLIYEIIYNDLLIDETYVYEEDKHNKLNVPLVVMTGLQDKEAPIEDMEEWKQYTNSRFYIKQFDSDHFFLFNCDEFDPYFDSLLKKVSFNML